MPDDSEKTVKKTATYWYPEASSDPANDCTNVSTEQQIDGVENTPGRSKDMEVPPEKWSVDGNSLGYVDKSISRASTTQSSPRTPPIRERSVKRVQRETNGSTKKLHVSCSKKTKLCEKALPLLPLLPLTPSTQVRRTPHSCTIFTASYVNAKELS